VKERKTIVNKNAVFTRSPSAGCLLTQPERDTMILRTSALASKCPAHYMLPGKLSYKF